jgi:hypothetical protein
MINVYFLHLTTNYEILIMLKKNLNDPFLQLITMSPLNFSQTQQTFQHI